MLRYGSHLLLWQVALMSLRMIIFWGLLIWAFTYLLPARLATRPLVANLHVATLARIWTSDSPVAKSISISTIG